MSGTEPEKGKVTFQSEGTEGGLYHSRKLHVPTASSGLTLGRGYDLRFKSKGEVKVDLIKIGLKQEKADAISGAVELYGEKVKKYITGKSLEEFELTQDQQKKLFEITYEKELQETKRLCTKSDVEKVYGKCDWDKLDSNMKEILVDLKFRGDYTPAVRKKIQKIVSNNDAAAFYEIIKKRENWPNVPSDRFNSRAEYLKNKKK